MEHNLDLLGTLGTLFAPGGKLSIAEVELGAQLHAKANFGEGRRHIL